MIDLYSGFIIDSTVMSKYCTQCVLAKKKFGEATPEFSAWYEMHQVDCQINHTESSGAMEKAAAEIMWNRSLSHGMRYTKMVSDGDSNAYKNIVNLNIYGQDVEIQKEECVNHVQKRLYF